MVIDKDAEWLVLIRKVFQFFLNFCLEFSKGEITLMT